MLYAESARSTQLKWTRSGRELQPIKSCPMNESHNVPIPLSGPDPTLSETRVSSDKVRWVEISNNCNFIRIHQPSRTGGNGSRNSAVSMWDINSSLIVLLIYGTLFLQQLSLAQVWLFLNEIQPSWRSAAFYVTQNNKCSYVFIIGSASLHVMYFITM